MAMLIDDYMVKLSTLVQCTSHNPYNIIFYMDGYNHSSYEMHVNYTKGNLKIIKMKIAISLEEHVTVY